MNTRTVVVISAWALAASAWGTAQSRAPLISTIDTQVGAAPALARVSGRDYLVYELHVTNVSRSDVTVARVEVRDAVRRTALADLRDAALSSRLGRVGAPSGSDTRVVGAGQRAVVYLWLRLDGVPAPSRVEHVIGVEAMRAGERVSLSVSGADAPVRQERPIVLQPPLRGGPWVALYDPMLVGGHRTAIYAVDGRARIPARFAIDFVRLEDDGSPARGDRSAIANWHGYGAEVLAVAEATVIGAHDDIVEAPTLEKALAPIPLENVSGNYVSLDLGGGRYAFYEHLKHGSIRVKAGDRINAGDVVGLLGNSGGSSSGPHLHFHVADGRAELAAEGIPFAFAAFDAAGIFDSVDAFMTGERWKPMPAEAGGRRRDEMPAPNSVIVFPEP